MFEYSQNNNYLPTTTTNQFWPQYQHYNHYNNGYSSLYNNNSQYYYNDQNVTSYGYNNEIQKHQYQKQTYNEQNVYQDYSNNNQNTSFKQPSYNNNGQYAPFKSNKRLSEDGPEQANIKRFCGNSQTVSNYGYQPLVIPNTQNSTKKFNRSISMIEDAPYHHQAYKKSNELENYDYLFNGNGDFNQNSYNSELQQVNSNYHYQTNKNQTSYNYRFNSQNESNKLNRTTSMVHNYQNSLEDYNFISKQTDQYGFNNEQNSLYSQESELKTIRDDQSQIKNKKNSFEEPSKKLKENLEEEVTNVMSLILSIFDSIDLLEKNKIDKTSSNNGLNGIFPSHIISSIFEITVGEK